MKKALFLLLLFLCLYSCNRVDPNEDASDGKVKVTFHLSGIEQIPFENTATRALTLSDYCSRFSLALFQDGNKVDVISQTAESADFGTLSLSLVPGSYQLVAVAHNGLGNCTISSPEKITFANNKLTDTFYSYGTIKVSETAAIRLVLVRPVAMFRLQITDPMPAEVAQMKFYYTGGSSTFDAVAGFGCVNSKQTELFAVDPAFAQSGSTFEVYTFPHADSDLLTMKVTAQDADGNTLAEQIYKDIPVRPNIISQHTTEFFTAQSSTVTVTSAVTLLGNGQWQQTEEY